MPEAYTDYELMERYLAGEMEPGEQEAFEAALNNDVAFRERFSAYRLFNEEYSGMEQSRAGEETLTTTMKQLKDKYFLTTETGIKKPAPVRKLIFALAAAASLLFAFFLLKPVLFGTGNKDLFGEYYVEEQFPRQRGVPDSATIAAGFYDKKEYTQTLNILEPYTNAHPEKTELLLFRGRCYIATAQYDKAVELFRAVTGSNAPQVFRDKAQWLHALVLLKQDKKEDGKKILQQIPEQSFYYKKAKELLADL